MVASVLNTRIVNREGFLGVFTRLWSGTDGVSIKEIVTVVKGGKVKQRKRKDGALEEWRVLSENNIRNCKVRNWRTLQLHLVTGVKLFGPCEVDTKATITSCTASSSAKPGTIDDTRVARRSLKFSEEDWNAINMIMVIEMDGDTNIQIDNGQLELLTITMGEEVVETGLNGSSREP
ncbi:Hypothetical predicted protein [Prunus dulcis]|uniref:Uncharacterized protein n=1 Tax=Prunus dulcis TaxID=3755 RepID=A0A5E4FEH0_PRUDU|nr:Hypothetical predicted protein [Prunus dulcis]